MTTLLVLGLGLGNIGMGWILIGQILIFPIVSFIHFICRVIGFGQAPYSDTLVFLPNYQSSPVTVFVSAWIVEVVYFFTFVALNAYDVYNADPVNAGSDYNVQINNRKARTKMIMIVAVVLGLSLVMLRLFGSSEAPFGEVRMIVGTVLSIGLGVGVAWGWNALSTKISIGPGKQDIFGISQQMILTTQTDKTVMCEASNV